jgi:CHASE2 domain-containing sensor protein
VLIGVGALAAAAAIASYATGVLARPERTTVDARFSLRGSRRPPPDVVIVAIDEDSLAQLPRFPFSRALYVPVIARLHAADARVIALDIAFDRPTTTTADEQLRRAISRARPVVLGSSEVDQFGRTEVLGGPSFQRAIGARVGATLMPHDSSGVIRQIAYQVHGLRSFALVVASLARAKRVPPSAFAHGAVVIDYLGGAGTFPTVSFVDVLEGRASAALFRHRLVIVGDTAASGQDLHPTPLGLMTGAEVQANALATILAGFPLRAAPGWLTVLLIVVLAMIAPLASLWRGALVTLAAAGSALLALVVGAQVAFDAGLILDFSDCALALVLSTGATVGVDYGYKEHERNRLREMFASFSPEVVAQVLAGSSVTGSLGALPLSATGVIGGYRMEEIVGRGAMGVVYKATQLALERPVAVKVISPEHAARRMFRERFERESRMAASVEHPNIIPV